VQQARSVSFVPKGDARPRLSSKDSAALSRYSPIQRRYVSGAVSRNLGHSAFHSPKPHHDSPEAAVAHKLFDLKRLILARL
jgi:hypothetical protein